MVAGVKASCSSTMWSVVSSSNRFGVQMAWAPRNEAGAGPKKEVLLLGASAMVTPHKHVSVCPLFGVTYSAGLKAPPTYLLICEVAPVSASSPVPSTGALPDPEPQCIELVERGFGHPRQGLFLM